MNYLIVSLAAATISSTVAIIAEDSLSKKHIVQTG
jgi:hypothetical protein